MLSTTTVIADNKTRLAATALGAAVGLGFAAGFIATAEDLVRSIPALLGLGMPSPPWSTYVGFPALASVFFFSMPGASQTPDNNPRHSSWLSLAVPILIAMVYGVVHPNRGWLYAKSFTELVPLLWIGISVPLAEEFLFRGWLYTCSQRLWPRTLFTATNALPVAVWVSATGFALWHVQNISHMSVLATAFQCGYTFALGLWLGAIRYWTGAVWRPLAFHMAINVAGAAI